MTTIDVTDRRDRQLKTVVLGSSPVREATFYPTLDVVLDSTGGTAPR
jgi:hypothetical protein